MYVGIQGRILLISRLRRDTVQLGYCSKEILSWLPVSTSDKDVCILMEEELNKNQRTQDKEAPFLREAPKNWDLTENYEMLCSLQFCSYV